MYDEAAIVEAFVGETTHRDKEATAYAEAMERLWKEAVTGEDARRLIVRATNTAEASGVHRINDHLTELAE